MKNLFNLIVVAVFINVCVAKADDSILVQNDICSGERTTETSEILTLKCDGNFTLSGGTITTDKKLIIRSSGSIILDNILVFANEIEVHSPVAIKVGEQALLSATGSVTYTIDDRGDLTIMGGGTTITGGVIVLSSDGMAITGVSSVPATNGFAIKPSATITTEGTISPISNDLVIMPSTPITTEGTLLPLSDGITNTESAIIPMSDSSSSAATSEVSQTSSSKQASTNSGAGMINFWNLIFFIICVSISKLYSKHGRYFGWRNSV